MTQPHQPFVTVVVATRNRPEDLARCLPSLAQLQYPAFEILVVDQGDSEETEELVRRLDIPSVRYFRNSDRGKSKAMNFAHSIARGEIYAYTDDDCVVGPEWLDRGVAELLSEPDSGMLFGNWVACPHDPAVAFVPEFPIQSRRVVRGRQLASAGLGVGGNMFVRRNVFDELGPFDEDLGPGGPFHNGEDYELTYRVLKGGLSVIQSPEGTVVHHGARPWEDGIARSLILNAYLAIGAGLAKHVRGGDLRAAMIILWESTRLAADMLSRAVTRKRPLGARRLFFLWRGAVAGFRAGRVRVPANARGAASRGAAASGAGVRHPGRIIFILQGGSVGGMETHVIDLAGEYRRRGAEVCTVLSRREIFNELPARLEALDVQAVRIDVDGYASMRDRLANLWALARLCRRFRPNVVHLHSGSAIGGLPLVTTAWLARVPAIVLSEHLYPDGTQHYRGRRYVFAKRVMDRICDVTVAVSRHNATIRARELFAPRHCAVVLNGVPIESTPAAQVSEDRARVRAELGLGAADVVLGSLVRLADGKGLPDLLRAVSLMTNTEARLLLVGDGPLREQLEVLARELGIAGRVTFAGHRPQPAPYLHAMDVFVLAVPSGSMSIALLEAMRAGLPPVITFGGPEEAVIDGETGLTAKPDDPADLARALDALAGDPGRRTALGAAAVEHVRSHFSVGRVADDLMDVYDAARFHTPLPPRLRPSSPPNPRPGDSG
jgi:glycosyltransferase involved in cell wall biosynthesis/GT2 family glycosyltransferase